MLPQGRLERAVLLVAALSLLVTLAWFNAYAHLHDPIWQDEAATLLNFSSKGWLEPFLHYRTPNNHVLFSAMLGAWLRLFSNGVDLATMRALPFGLYLAAVPTTFFAARRMRGTLAAAVATLLFASSAVSANFAAQLRGYAPSWPCFALLLWCALNVGVPRRRWWRIGYAACCVAVTALLPSNFFQAFAIGIAAGLHLLLTRGWRGEGTRSGLALLLSAPFAGFLVYAGAWRELLAFGNGLYSEWTRAGLMLDWLHAVHADFWFLVPLIAAGAAAGCARAWRALRVREVAGAADFVLAISLLLGLGAVVVVMPHTPFPRTLVGYLPVWLCAIGALVAMAVDALRERRQLAAMGGAALLAAMGLFALRPIASCRGATDTEDPVGYDLCYQYFHDGYRPEAVVSTWAQLGHPEVPIVTDYEGYYSLAVLGVNGLQVHQFEYWPRQGLPVPLVVAHDRAGFERIAAALHLQATHFVRVADTGFFEIYAWPEYGARLPPGY